MSCAQPWYQRGEPCPYGTGVKGFDVTIPNNITFGEAVCVFYSFLPYFVICCGFVWAVLRQTAGNWAFVLLPGVVAVLAKLWKAAVSEPRPLGSCLQGCGMPSSHSQVSLSFLAWLLISGAQYNGRRVTRWRQIAWIVAWSVIIAPTPPCRIVIGDHSAPQVLIGCAIGLVGGSCWFWLVKVCARRSQSNCISKLIDCSNISPPFLEWWMGTTPGTKLPETTAPALVKATTALDARHQLRLPL